MSDHAAMKARAEQAFTHYVAPLQILPGPDEPVHLARKLAADVLELLAALDALVAERDEARRERDVYFQRWHEAETAAEARVTELEAALASFRVLVETFSYAGPFTSDDGKGLRGLSDEAWLNLRPRMETFICDAAALAAPTQEGT